MPYSALPGNPWVLPVSDPVLLGGATHLPSSQRDLESLLIQTTYVPLTGFLTSKELRFIFSHPKFGLDVKTDDATCIHHKQTECLSLSSWSFLEREGQLPGRNESCLSKLGEKAGLRCWQWLGSAAWLRMFRWTETSHGPRFLISLSRQQAEGELGHWDPRVISRRTSKTEVRLITYLSSFLRRSSGGRFGTFLFS